MKKIYCLYTLIAALTMVMGAAISADVLADDGVTTVEIKNYKFGPESVNIAPGQSVVWKNLDGSTHTILIDGKESPGLGKDADYSQVFSKPGSYKYQCGRHSSMRGVINVVGTGNQSSSVSSAGKVSPIPSVAKQDVVPSIPVSVNHKASAVVTKLGVGGPVAVPAHASDKQSAGNVVSIVDFMRFSPAVLTVKVGTTVTWKNFDGSNHIVVMGGVRSPRLRHDSSFSHTFDKAGEYSYICGIHGDKMSGKIIVK